METLLSKMQPLYNNTINGLDEYAFAIKSSEEMSGQVAETKFNGVIIRQSNFVINKPVQFKIETSEPIFEMHFSLNGYVEINNHKQKEKVGINSMQHNIVGIPPLIGDHSFPQITNRNCIEIILTRSFFERLINENCRLQCKLLENLDKGIMSLAGKQHLNITPQMQLLLHDIVQSKRKGYLKKMYIEAKVLELLMLQIEAFETSSDSYNTITQKDRDTIWQVKELIDKNPDDDHTLNNLAKTAGVNTFKLKKGFKQIFGQTVFEYIHNLKMEKARQLLLDNKLNVSEVAYTLGYNSPNNFSTAFKKKYGMNPNRTKSKKII